MLGHHGFVQSTDHARLLCYLSFLIEGKRKLNLFIDVKSNMETM